MNNYKKNFYQFSFVYILGIGAVVSLTLRWLLESTSLKSHLGSSVALLVCVLGLLFYYFIVARQAKTGQHNPDNLYYMGLLFTLLSLVYSLVTLFILHAAEGDESARVNNLVGSFGIALMSTFLGILLRILLLQRGDMSPPEPEGQALIAHQGLAETARELRQELTQTLADMSVFRKSFIQANDETVREAAQARAAMMQQVQAAADEQTRIFASLTQKVQQPLEALARVQTERLEEAVTRNEKLEAVFNALEEALQSTLRNLQATAKGAHDLSVEYDALNTRLQDSAHLLGQVGDEIKQVAETLTTHTEALSESLTEATQIMPEYAEEFVQLIASLRQEAAQWQSMTQEVRSSLVQAVADLTQLVKQ